MQSAVESLESETTVVKKSVKKSTKTSKSSPKKKTSTTESSSITSSKAESFENSFSNGSVEVVEEHRVETVQTSVKSNKSIDSSSGKDAIASPQESPEHLPLENGGKKKVNGKKKSKKSKKSDSEKENISVVSQTISLSNKQFLPLDIPARPHTLMCCLLLLLYHFVFLVPLHRVGCCVVLCRVFFILQCLMHVKLIVIKLFNRLSLLTDQTASTLSLPGSVKVSPSQKSHRNNFVVHNVKTDDTDCERADVANNNLDNDKASRKFIMSSSLQLHEDDLSRIDVKSLVSDVVCFLGTISGDLVRCNFFFLCYPLLQKSSLISSDIHKRKASLISDVNL